MQNSDLNVGSVMGQLTLARFRGDTTFGLFTRIVSTFVGGIIGMMMWCVSAQISHVTWPNDRAPGIYHQDPAKETTLVW